MKTMKTIVMGFLCLATTGLFAAPIYLKADAPGGGDGTSWSTAYNNIDEAASHLGAENNVIYAARGIYSYTATIKPSVDFEIYGGFKGESMAEDLDSRDVDEYQTIITGDVTKDDYWRRITPSPSSAGMSWGTVDKTDLVLRDDGSGRYKVYIHPDSDYNGATDGFGEQVVGANTSVSLFDLTSGVGAVLDGFWVTGVSGGVNVILLQNTAKASTFRNLRFVGNYAGSLFMQSYGNALSPNLMTYEGCKFIGNHMKYTVWGLIMSKGSCKLTDCEFVSNFSVDSYGVYAALVFDNEGGTAEFEDCVFARNCGVGHYAYSGRQAIAYSGGAGTTGTFRNCRFDGNVAYRSDSNTTTSLKSFAIVYSGNAQFSDCVFVNNAVQQRVTGGYTYSPFRNCNAAVYERCLFATNAVYGTISSATTSDDALLGTVGNMQGSVAPLTLVSCAFRSNTVSCVDTEDFTVRRSCGVVCGLSSAGTDLAVVNCSFEGVGDGSSAVVHNPVPNETGKLRILNSVFTTDEGDFSDYLHTARPELVELRDCNVKQVVRSELGIESSGWSYDDIPLDADFVPQAKVPDIRTSCDVAVADDTVVPQTYQYRLSDADDWQCVNPLRGATLAASPAPVADLYGEARAFGSFTRGAVQALSSTAESGATVVFRREPFDAGTLEGGKVTQCVSAGGEIEAVTAVRGTPRTEFKGWYEGETLLSEDEELTLSELTAGTHVATAVFAPPKVRLTFDLGAAGTFTESGKSCETVEVEADTVLADAVPEYELKDGWSQEGWKPSLVGRVGYDDAYYLLRSHYGRKIVYVVPPEAAPEGSDGSGFDWVNPMTEIKAAYQLAASWGGEVWIRRGLYVLKDTVTPVSNVHLIGGFAGDETSAAAADPVANPTIIGGNWTWNNYWTTNSCNNTGVSQGKVWIDGVYNPPQTAKTDAYWGVNFSGSTTTYGFHLLAGDPQATNLLFRGLTLTGFKYNAVNIMRTDSDLTFLDCRIVANCNRDEYDRVTTGHEYTIAAVQSASQVTLSNCTVCANQRGIYLKGSGNDITNRVTDCLFEDNYSSIFCVSLTCGCRPTVVSNCTFRNNSSVGATYGGKCGAGLTLEGTAYTKVEDCDFLGNRVRGGGSGTVVAKWGSGHKLYFDRCRFVGNTYRGTLTEVAVGSASYYSPVFALELGGSAGTAVARDSLFASNSLFCAATSATSSPLGSVLSHRRAYFTFVNCSFDGNSAVSDPASDAAYPVRVGTFVGWDSTMGDDLALINCSIRNSVLSGSLAAECAWHSSSRYRPTLVNCAVENTTEGYVPFRSVNTVDELFVWNSTIPNFDASVFSPTASFTTNLVSASSTFDAKLVSSSGRWPEQLQLSPFGRRADLRAGRPVWRSSNGYYWIYDPLYSRSYPWRNVSARSMQNEGHDCTLETPSEPDAFGRARRARRPAIGALEGPKLGLSILVR